ncbi:MAG: type II toxin-antitoxin system RelE/ParE family toxin [Myxococcota bacterium]
MYEIEYQPEAAAELQRIRAYDRVRILDEIAKHLAEAPLAMKGRRKKLDLGDGDFVYQLRVGEFRVFYDVDENEGAVIVRHVRRKGRNTTGETL